LDLDGAVHYSDTITIDGGTTGVPELPGKRFALHQSSPNPFNPIAVISFQLPVGSDVRLVVYDLLGRDVAQLVNERKPAGSHSVNFDGAGLSTGVYICRLTAGRDVETIKMVLIR
jgi:hypothetical protein